LRSLNSLAVIAIPSLRRPAPLAICQPQVDVESKCVPNPPPAAILFIIAKREQNKTVLSQVEWLIFGVIVVAAIASPCSLASGAISI